MWARSIASISALLCCLGAHAARAQLPEGYLVWVHGELGDMTSRKVHRVSLPGLEQERVLTSGEDVECQVSPDGRWVAYAKAKLPGGTDYHAFSRWSLYLVSIEGVDGGGEELLVDADGYWPSWGADGTLYYSQADGQHTIIMRVTLDLSGAVVAQVPLLSTREAFPSIPEINECFVAPDASWFAGRTRGISDSGVGAYAIDPPRFERLAWAGSSGCMPYVAPSGSWGFNAGSTEGILWGDAPDLPDRRVDQQLIAAKPGGRCYHPGTSSDGQWVLTGHSSSDDQNAGPWDVYIYRLQDHSVSDEQLLAGGGFNGWPHVWVRPSTGDAGIDAGRDAGIDPGRDAAGAADIGAGSDRARPDAGADAGAGGDAAHADAGTAEAGVDAAADAGIMDTRGADAARAGEQAQRTAVSQGCACTSVAGGPRGTALLGWLLLATGRRRARGHEDES